MECSDQISVFPSFFPVKLPCLKLPWPTTWCRWTWHILTPAMQASRPIWFHYPRRMKGWADLGEPGMKPQYHMNEKIKSAHMFNVIDYFLHSRQQQSSNRWEICIRSANNRQHQSNQLQFRQKCHQIKTIYCKHGENINPQWLDTVF